MEKQNPQYNDDQSKQVDSPINTDGAKGNEGKDRSLTPDERANTDPNEVSDKPSFSDNKQ